MWVFTVPSAMYRVVEISALVAPFAISTRKTFEPSNRNTGNFHMNVSLAYGRKLAPEGLEALRLGGNGKAVKDFTPSDCLGISNSGLIEYRTVEQLLESVGRTGNDYYKNLTHNVLDKVKSERKSRFVSRHDNLVKKVTASPRYAAMLGWQRREVDLTVSLAPEEVPFAVNRRMGIGMTFPAALKSFLRCDPDIILVGEIRNLETMSTALMAADTGHLVMSTLHTTDVVQSIQRIISFYPPHQHDEIRQSLSSNLRAVI